MVCAVGAGKSHVSCLRSVFYLDVYILFEMSVSVNKIFSDIFHV